MTFTLLISCGPHEDVDADGVGQDIQLELIDGVRVGLVAAVRINPTDFGDVAVVRLQQVLSGREQLLDKALNLFEKCGG